jgi:hypothetical protein
VILSAILARNEAGRDLKAVLANARQWADRILLLDDHSTDTTAKIARKAGAEVVTRGESGAMWGKEASARAELWQLATDRVGTGWAIVQDADMLLVGDPRPLTQTWLYNTWSWVLYDCWSETEYRSDQFWRGHEFPRAWMFCPSRVPEGWVPQWPERGVHCGHAPANWPSQSGVVGADVVSWRHRAYIDPERRQAKLRQYESVLDQLSPFEASHARSICDTDRPASGPVCDGGPSPR